MYVCELWQTERGHLQTQQLRRMVTHAFSRLLLLWTLGKGLTDLAMVGGRCLHRRFRVLENICFTGSEILELQRFSGAWLAWSDGD